MIGHTGRHRTEACPARSYRSHGCRPMRRRPSISGEKARTSAIQGLLLSVFLLSSELQVTSEGIAMLIGSIPHSSGRMPK